MISILCPSRGRPEQFQKMFQSAKDTADSDFQFLGYHDLDDPLVNGYMGGVYGPCRHLGPAYQHLYEICIGDIVMMCADDLIFRTKGWDTRVKEAMPKDGIGVVSFDDLSKKEHGHPFIGRKFIETVGYLCHPSMNHSCIDNWIVDIAKEVTRFYYLPDVVIEHVHPKYKKGEWDDTYKRNDEKTRNKDSFAYRHIGSEEIPKAIKRVAKHLYEK